MAGFGYAGEILKVDLSGGAITRLPTASRKGAVVERAEFEKMKDEYYTLRGWDVASGLQTRDGLEKLGLKDIADDLESRGLLK